LGNGCAEKHLLAFRHAVCRCRIRIHNEAGTGSSCSAMMQHYPTTSTFGAKLNAQNFILSHEYPCLRHLSPASLMTQMDINSVAGLPSS